MSDVKTGSGSGFGKLILFGEHFVVYHVPALVAAVDAVTTCTVKVRDIPPQPTDTVTQSNDTAATTSPVTSFPVKITDNRPAVPGYKSKKKDEQDESARIVLRFLKHTPFDGKDVEIEFAGDLPCTSGIGASAASCVALARAISEASGLKLSEDEINAAAYEGEKGYHGTPSGIDNTASTFGGLLRFKRTEAEPEYEVLKLKESCRIVYASTGITASTTEVVGDVRRLKETQPEIFDPIMSRYESLVKEGESACIACDWPKVASLVNENHGLCQKITVSCKELDDLVDAAKKAGAIGAKMSGTGRGGLMLAIAPSEQAQKDIAEALKEKAPFVWTAEIGAASKN